MPFIFKPNEKNRLVLKTGDQDFTLILDDIPSTALFELAQIYQDSAKRNSPSGDRTIIPSSFVRKAVDAIIHAARDWEGVSDQNNNPLPFSHDTLRDVLESDISLIPQLISYIAEIFTRSQKDLDRLADEEKN